MGLPGFEPESIEPKSTSLDQASRQPRCVLLTAFGLFSCQERYICVFNKVFRDMPADA